MTPRCWPEKLGGVTVFAVQWGRRAEGFPLDGDYLVIFDHQCKMLPRCPGGKVE